VTQAAPLRLQHEQEEGLKQRLRQWLEQGQGQVAMQQ
jgi:hypothetical protein